MQENRTNDAASDLVSGTAACWQAVLRSGRVTLLPQHDRAASVEADESQDEPVITELTFHDTAVDGPLTRVHNQAVSVHPQRDFLLVMALFFARNIRAQDSESSDFPDSHGVDADELIFASVTKNIRRPAPCVCCGHALS